MSSENNAEKFIRKTLCPRIQQSSANWREIDINSLLQQEKNPPEVMDIFEFIEDNIVRTYHPGNLDLKSLIKILYLTENIITSTH